MSNYPPPEKVLDITEEFLSYVTSQKTVTDYQYFVDELEKLHPDDKRKLFYNIAQKIKELSN